MQDIVQEMLMQKVWAVLGSFANEEKWAYKIYKNLKKSGYTVYPVNPRLKEIDGEPCYQNLESLPQVPEVVNLVTPPQATEKIVEQCIKLGIKYVWMQPGAESEEAIKKAENAGLNVIHNTCVYKLTL
ncbi:MAG: CoA-binding protein [Desulfotomaculum sp.]|nr:CoA-binding protein [Desulfotomaculum sp.]